MLNTYLLSNTKSTLILFIPVFINSKCRNKHKSLPKLKLTKTDLPSLAARLQLTSEYLVYDLYANWGRWVCPF